MAGPWEDYQTPKTGKLPWEEYKPGLPPSEELPDPLASRPGAIIPRTLQPLVQGATLGFGDELLSAGAGLTSLVSGGGFGKAYERAQEAQRQDLEQVRREYPKSSIATQVIGSLATAPASIACWPAPGWAPVMARSAVLAKAVG